LCAVEPDDLPFPDLVAVRPAADEERPLLTRVAGDEVEVEVEVEWRGRRAVGAGGVGQEEPVAAARATLAALDELSPGLGLRLRWLGTTVPGGDAPSFASVVVVARDADHVGSAIVRSDPRVAVARAVLAALNRTLVSL